MLKCKGGFVHPNTLILEPLNPGKIDVKIKIGI